MTKTSTMKAQLRPATTLGQVLRAAGHPQPQLRRHLHRAAAVAAAGATRGCSGSGASVHPGSREAWLGQLRQSVGAGPWHVAHEVWQGVQTLARMISTSFSVL